MTIRLYWLIRFTGFAVIGIVALLNPPDHPPDQQLDRVIQIACFSVVGLALVAWLLLDEFPGYRRRGLPIVLGVIAAASGLAAVTAGGGQSLVAFAAVAAVAAGADLDPPSDILAATAVAAAGILPIWIVGPLVGCTFGTLAGYPLLIAACVSLGRNRRSYRVQAQQSAALLEQYERLRAEQRRADVLDERTRIAREIHDVLAHSLGALGIQIQAAKAMLTDHQDIDRAVDALSTAQRMAADGLTETRRAVHALRVDTLPLAAELDGLVSTHQQRYQVPVTFETSGAARPLPPDATLALLRTAQEALVNAAKHASGEDIGVRLDYGEHDVRLTIVNHLNGNHRRGPRAGQRRRLRADRHGGTPAAAERHADGRPARRGVGGDRRPSASVSEHGRRIGSRIHPRVSRAARGDRLMSADQPLRVVIADDQASVREGLVLLLGGLPGIDVVGAAADGEQALELVAEQQPDAILLDLHMPVLDGIGATRRLTAEHPGVAIVVLTTYADDNTVIEALQAGARSYLTKDADRTDIGRALQAAAEGLTVFDPRVRATLLAAAAGSAAAAPAAPAPSLAESGAAARTPEPPDGLTHREVEILGLIAQGLTNPEIAGRLFLSNHTVKTHINRIFAKTGSRDRVAAIAYAQRHNLS